MNQKEEPVMMKRSMLFLSCLFVSLSLFSCATDTAMRKNQAEASRRLGEGYLAEGNPTAALREFLKAEKLYEKDAFLQNDLGLAYSEKGKLDLAISHFKKAIALQPDYSEAHNSLGAVYSRIGQWDIAIESFNQARANLLYSTPHLPLSNLGRAYREKKDYDSSIAFYKKALEANRYFPPAHRGLALTYMAMGDYEAAISCLEKAVQYAPRFAVAYFDLGRAYAGQFATGKAISAFKMVVELAADTPLADSALDEIRKLRE
jgi:type IV pilus assembly protein PilF